MYRIRSAGAWSKVSNRCSCLPILPAIRKAGANRGSIRVQAIAKRFASRPRATNRASPKAGGSAGSENRPGRLLQVHYPTLRRTDALFPDWDSYDFSLLEHQGYRQTVRKIELIRRHLCSRTKFDTVSRYKLANLHYVVARSGILRPTELPIGWGLLESADLQTINETLPAKLFPSTNSPWWLERIARSATSHVMRGLDRLR